MNKKLANNYSIDQSIIEILKYKSIFNCAASYYQILVMMPYSKTLRMANFDKSLEKLLKKKKIKRTNSGKYYLATLSTTPENWRKNYKKASRLIKKAYAVTRLLSKIRWIKMVGVTGSVAAYNANKEADIDLLIVTRSHRVWLTRFFVVMLLKIINMYPTINKNSGKICPNIFIDTKSLNWKEKNIYTAHEILCLQPIFDRDQTYFNFISKNSWVKEYHPNMGIWQNLPKPLPESRGSRIIDLLEGFAWKKQHGYMKTKITTETVTPNSAHFNKFDHTQIILDKLSN